ncbi:hypothetical protein [Flavobacterium hydrophilum]|uniref:Uncharacterized protein n=1 Tax=Flavobacterium hydrophilum TaxID=2211445 RepID=A0A2V4C1Y9_9FLAO|nr:hypothetical protein [Flavobacterium hydrophilum]PXY45308.1 hypothetical protein DMB68_11535 [Flavobacterium hydrophilum]
MKNCQKKTICLIIFSIFLNISNTHCQTKENSSLYDYFDNAVGKDNLNINNGVVHSEPFRTMPKNNRYYIDEFNIGELSFEDEIYADVNIKYDIYDDQVIYKQNGETDNFPITLIKDKVDFFTIKNKKFVNLKSETIKFPKIIQGIYEENFVESNISLYIKHRKEKIKVLQADIVYYNYIYYTDFVIKYNNFFYTVQSEKDIKTIFPSYKKEINDFYKTNKKLEHSDKKQFMENLAKQINGLLRKSSN